MCLSDIAAEERAFLARRRTWVIAGVLLLLSALVSVAARGPFAGISFAKDWLFAAAVILSVIGVGLAGSVTGRKPVGTVAAILLVIAPATEWYWFSLVPNDADNPDAGEDIWALVTMLYYSVVLALAIISVAQIARAKVLPSPWRWAPLWALIWTPIAVETGLNLSASGLLGSATAILGSIIWAGGPAAATAFLGILGIVLGLRRARTSPAEVRAHRGHGDAPGDPAASSTQR